MIMLQTKGSVLGAMRNASNQISKRQAKSEENSPSIFVQSKVLARRIAMFQGLDPVEPAVFQKLDTIESAILHGFDPVESAIFQGLDPVESAIFQGLDLVKSSKSFKKIRLFLHQSCPPRA